MFLYCGVDMVFGSSDINRASFDIAKTLDMNILDTSDEAPLIVVSSSGDLQRACELMENESLGVNLSDSSGCNISCGYADSPCIAYL